MITRISTNTESMLEISHYREVAAFRLVDGYIGPHIYLAFAMSGYDDSEHYHDVWSGIVWC